MRKISNSELKKIVDLHQKWLRGVNGGCKADLSKADLSKADLRWANLRWADLSDANLSKADLSEADLRWANLRWADLSDANLSKADLRWADLSDANLSEADLRWADLSDANLSKADLRWADLRWADLSDANLSEADLRWADFSEIKGFECVCFIISTSCRNRLVNYIPSLDVITAGCFQGTLEEFKKQVEETHKDNEFVLNRYRRVIAFMEQEKKFDDERV